MPPSPPSDSDPPDLAQSETAQRGSTLADPAPLLAAPLLAAPLLAAPLLAAACAARRRAYAPYSSFKVGAAVRGASGRVFSAANVENAAYPLSLCAEAAAIAAAIGAGETRLVAALVVAAPAVAPCGGCRQRLAEFMAPSAPVFVADGGGVRATYRLGDLLPHAFGPDAFERRAADAPSSDPAA